MLIKIPILIIILYFFALLQSSFLPHFAIFGYVPNLIFIFAIFLFFFLPALPAGQAGGRQVIPSLGFTSAFFGGIFLDIFSSHFIGFYTIILLGILFFIKFIVKKYVRLSIG